MTKGKSICKVLKGIRKQVADANDIDYEPIECHHKGDCLGTCPACESEVSYIENQLDIRKQLGKAVVVVGLSAGLLAMTGCDSCSVPSSAKGSIESGKTETDSLIDQTVGEVAVDDTVRSEFLKEDSLKKLRLMESTDGMISEPPADER